MSNPSVALVGIIVLFVMIFLRVPIALALMLVGGVGFAALTSTGALLNMMNSQAYWQFSNYDLSVVPLFILMGQFATHSGLSRELFAASNAVLSRFRGGVAMASIAGCGGFGAICGSSLATAATIGKVALPELRRFGYSDGLATGALAAGGTLGILIPPSVLLVVYAIIVEANIVTMFQAAFIPGFVALLGYMLVIAIVVRVQPGSGPAGEEMTWAERFAAIRGVWSIVFIFGIVIGGIYLGVFTPTEAAAVGVVLTGILAAARGRLSVAAMGDICLDTLATTVSIFMIVLGAQMFSGFIALTQVTSVLTGWFSDSGLSPYVVLAIMLAVFVLLGCVMDSVSMIFLVVPIFWPILSQMDFGLSPAETKIWFGIIALIVIEMGLITPPVGMNVYIVNSLAPDIPMKRTFVGVLPFLMSDVFRVVLLIALPGLSLWLPRLLQ